MRIAKDGFIRWFIWAFFSCAGRIKRLPYIVAFICLIFIARIYINIAAQAAAVYIVPPAGGGAPSPEYVMQVASSLAIIPFLLPVCYIYIALDLKRLRSIGLSLPFSLALSGILSGLSPFAPIFAPALVQAVMMTTFAYRAILAVIPAKEDRLSPQERKYHTWCAIATGDGTPRHLTSADIKHWRFVKGPENKRKKKKSK